MNITQVGVEVCHLSRRNGYVIVTEMETGWSATVAIINRVVRDVTLNTDLDEAEEFFTDYYKEITEIVLTAWLDTAPT